MTRTEIARRRRALFDPRSASHTEGMWAVCRAGALLGVLAWGPGPASAQDRTSLSLSAAIEAQRALAMGRCTTEASELASAAERLRAEDDALLTRALTSYVTSLRAQLSTCMGPIPSAAPAVRGFAVVEDALEATGGGAFDPQRLMRLISVRGAAIDRCYQSELRRTPSLAGRVRVTVTIGESGRVTAVRIVESTMASDRVGACLVRVIRGFRFSPGPTGGAVTYTFPVVFGLTP